MSKGLPAPIDADGAALIVALASNGYSGTELLLLSGYSQETIEMVLNATETRALIRAGAQQWLDIELGPMALKVLKEFAESKPKTDAEKRMKLDAAKTLADRAGYVPPRAADASAGAKPLSEMSLEEIEAELARKKSERADQARPVLDGAPSPTVARKRPPKAADMLD